MHNKCLLLHGLKMDNDKQSYWKENLWLMLMFLAVWFLVSFVCCILAIDYLNQFRFFGYKLGFWFSQQGSIYVFVILIFVYAWKMNRLDKQYGVREDDDV